MDKSDSPSPIDDHVDHRIRMYRESSICVTDEQMKDLLGKSQHEEIDTAATIRARFLSTLSSIVNLENEYSRKIKELEEALEKAKQYIA